jgi:hypothetical protein
VAICQTAGEAFFIGEMETFGESRDLDFDPAIKRDDFGPIGFGDAAHLRRFRSLGLAVKCQKYAAQCNEHLQLGSGA